MRQFDQDSGFSALWTAMVLFFIVGLAALAVDVSGFYQGARSEQRGADLTCLAGVRELPSSPSAALNAATDFAQSNFPELASTAPSVTGTVAVLDNGAGSAVTITAAADGDPEQMSVQVTQLVDSFFGRVLGASSATVSQEAYCKVLGIGFGDLPFGALPGGTFDGSLQDLNPCATGNCRPIELPRTDVAAGANRWFIRNLAIGSEIELIPSKLALSDPPLPGTVCAAGMSQCTIVKQDQGVSAGALSDGIARGSVSAAVDGRLENTSVATSTFPSPGGRTLDGDSYEQVIDPDPTSGPQVIVGLRNFPQKPDAWDDDVHGDWATEVAEDEANPSDVHLYFNGTIAKCDSPRFAFMPIVADLGWVPPNPLSMPPGNSDPVKVVGFYIIIIGDPDETGDFDNPSDSVRTISGRALWLGPDASCPGFGGIIKPLESGDAKTFRLVASP